jgi:hypothetical protein
MGVSSRAAGRVRQRINDADNGVEVIRRHDSLVAEGYGDDGWHENHTPL